MRKYPPRLSAFENSQKVRAATFVFSQLRKDENSDGSKRVGNFQMAKVLWPRFDDLERTEFPVVVDLEEFFFPLFGQELLDGSHPDLDSLIYC
jgi:hypothetical protein